MSNLKIGFARLDMTPPLGVPMAGYFFERLAEGVLDPLYLNAVAFSDGENAAVVMTCDLEGIASVTMDQWLPQIAETVGLPKEALFIACTHTHTGPHLAGNTLGKYDEQYDAWLLRRMCDTITMALRDCRPLKEMQVYEGILPDTTYVRRFKMKGGYYQTWAEWGDPNIEDIACQPDETMRIVRIFREEGPEIVLVNFQMHPDCISGSLYSADFPGFVRTNVEAARENTRCVFFNGAEGQLIAGDFRKPRGPQTPEIRYTNALRLGKKVSDFILAHMDEAKSFAGEGVSFGHRVLACKTKRDPSRLAEAERLIDIHENGDELNEIGPDWVATPLVTEAYTLRRLELGKIDYIDIPVSAVGAGGLSFLGIAGEPFCEIGQAIRQQSPYAVTFVVCKTNGSEGYYPTAEAYDQDGYEPRGTRFPKGIGEILRDEGIDLLNKIHK